jgi:tryptophan synthase beta chain
MLRDTGRARYVAITDTEALLALRELSRLEGIVPALESSHAVAWLLGAGREPAGGIDVLTLSGRGDKDLAEALAGLERLDADG